jgi:type VI secretion system protein ImpH
MATESGAENPIVVADSVPVPDTTGEPAGAGSNRESPSRYDAVAAALRNTPFEFEFFQAVRLLERMSLQSGRGVVGRFEQPGREVVRFSAHASFPFPASQIQRIAFADGAAPIMVINFMGLTGPSGVLPLYYTEMIVERIRAKDRAMASFFDMFNHRMTSLFYQAWEKYRFAIAYERGERDRVSQVLMDLLGLGTPGLSNRLAVRDDSVLYYAGLLGLHTRSASALQRTLEDYFDVPVQVEQFTGAWHRLRESDLCRFQRGSGASEQLGGGAIVGDEIYDQQSGVRILLGPLNLTQYLDFLPTGTAHEPLRSLTRLICNGEVDFEFQLILDKDHVPVCELAPGGEDEALAPRLGWTSWAKTRPLTEHARDTILQG